MWELEWKRFEQITEAYFNRIGWRTRPARIGPEGGVDIYLYKPDTTKVAAVVQGKAWNRYKVGVKPVRELYGVMAAESVSQGYFVTSSEYTREALSFVQAKNITLIDSSALIERIRALPKECQGELHRMATDGDDQTPTCPRCGRKMVRRIAEKGRGAGMPFWGCPAYPRCKVVLNVKNEADWPRGLWRGFFSLLR